MSDEVKVDELFYGEVIWFSAKKGFGFAKWEKDGVPQKDMFCHFSDVNATGFKTLFNTRKVSFNIGKNKRGEDKATNITVLAN